ncbi:DDE-type integrase/transposase/recombinase, partial [Paenochrobactrum sp. BZR 588]|uniref:DDE-type integrase/transposase/recombinase n=1 Tax=unclassified Paenochrobactrum TaxID=2639760 RepID=UPI003852F2AE
FKRTIETNGIPDKVVIDKSGANYAGLRNMNILFWLVGFYPFIDILQVKYLNNIIEQDHRFIKKIINPMRDFQSFATASATMDGIETAHMIHKGQFGMGAKSPFEQFAELAG